MNLDFSDPGNGPEVLWAGMFTLVAVIGSVLLALWSQHRDFDRREEEMNSAFDAQEEAFLQLRAVVTAFANGVRIDADCTNLRHPFRQWFLWLL